MTLFILIMLIFTVCIWAIIKNEANEIIGFSPVAAVVVLVIDIIFIIMLGGLYGGHIIFMCIYAKTTNEALKRSEKYGYKFK